MTLVMLYLFSFWLFWRAAKRRVAAEELFQLANKKCQDADVMLRQAMQSLENAQKEWISVRGEVRKLIKADANNN